MAQALTLTDAEPKGKLVEALHFWPLYRELVYTGAPGVNVVPQFVKMFCPVCLKEQIWETGIFTGSSGRAPEYNKRGWDQKTYECRNCRNAKVTYYFYWNTEKSGETRFFKVGQYPALEERVPNELRKALDAQDLDFYKTAIRLRNFGLGLGAVAYMRRVVENRMNDMLDVLHEVAREHKASEEVLGRLEGIKKERRFSVKVDYAGDLVPDNLRPAGQPNPMAVLHELASDGLHTKSDEECVDIFDQCRKTFEYVFGKLRVQAEEAKSFVKEFAELARKKP